MFLSGPPRVFMNTPLGFNEYQYLDLTWRSLKMACHGALSRVFFSSFATLSQETNMEPQARSLGYPVPERLLAGFEVHLPPYWMLPSVIAHVSPSIFPPSMSPPTRIKTPSSGKIPLPIPAHPVVVHTNVGNDVRIWRTLERK